MRFKIALLIIFCCLVEALPAQIDAQMFSVDSLTFLLHRGINEIRLKNALDTLDQHSIAQTASEIQAGYMAKIEKADLEGERKKYKDTKHRLISCGGSNKGEELVISATVSKGKDHYYAKEVASLILKKWTDSKKELPIIINSHYCYYGLKAELDSKGKKCYVSLVMAGYDLINNGFKKKKELAVPFTSKNRRMTQPTPQACKNCEKFKDYATLYEGLYIDEKGYLCLKYPNLKAFKKLLKGEGDALGVDIVQRVQYDNPDYNIYNHNLLTKGVLIKPLPLSKLLKQNKVDFTVKAKGSGRSKEQNLDTRLGKFPKRIAGDYEMNLLILQGGSLCKTVSHSYIESGVQKSTSNSEMLLMPDSNAYFNPPFKPEAESGLLTFKIPFEKNKYNYKEDELQPFLDALKEPDYSIEGIYITAYSSIEGDSVANATLQKNRAASIIAALKSKQKDEVVRTNVTTKDSWILFTMEMEGGPFDWLTKLPKAKAIHEINTRPGLVDSLEPYLSKERFAQMVLDVTYDIKGPKEALFCIAKFNNAIAKGDLKQAEKIQYFIFKNVQEGRYSPDILSRIDLGNNANTAGLRMNQLVYQYLLNQHTIQPDQLEQLKQLAAQAPDNKYITYNLLFTRIKTEPLNTTAVIDEMQKGIDKLYETNTFPRKIANDLNIELQFKIMEALDTVEGKDATLTLCINKIVSFYDIKSASWENSLKLAYLFMKHKEFAYAAFLLEPFIKMPSVKEDLLAAYISASSNVPSRLNSHAFVIALQTMKQLYPNRYCSLFQTSNLGFQVFDIPQVKDDYIKSNCR